MWSIDLVVVGVVVVVVLDGELAVVVANDKLIASFSPSEWRKFFSLFSLPKSFKNFLFSSLLVPLNPSSPPSTHPMHSALDNAKCSFTLDSTFRPRITEAMLPSGSFYPNLDSSSLTDASCSSICPTTCVIFTTLGSVPR